MIGKSGILLFTLFIGSFASPTPVSDETDVSDFFIHASEGSRIVGGSAAAAGSVPYMVGLTNGLFIRSFFCGGSLITDRHVLTAAHCTEAVFNWGSLSTTIRATVGTNFWNQGGQSYAISRNVSHPNYLSSTIKNDISILVTATNVILSELVQTIPLNFNPVEGGVTARAAGWGRIRHNGAISTSLLELVVTTIDGQQCVDDAIASSITLNMNAPPIEPHIELCTYHSPGHGMCNGDSGSALVALSVGSQIGIVSWGFPCALGAPDMFVRLSAYQDWVLDAVTVV